MQSEKTVRIMAYLNPSRSSDDRELLARMRAVRVRGITYAEQIRRGLRLLHFERISSSTDIQRLAETMSRVVEQSEVVRRDLAQAQADAEAATLALKLALYGGAEGRRRAEDWYTWYENRRLG